MLLFLSGRLFSQIQINGFGQAEAIKTFGNFKKIQTIDFNLDGKNDYILYGTNRKEVVIHRSLKNGKISKPIRKFFFYPVSEIKKLNDRPDFGSFYIVLSRVKRLAALITFTEYGTLQLLNKHKFESSPSGLIVADFNNDSKNEALVFGANFNGISALTEKRFVLKEKKIIDSLLVPTATLIDFNYDGLPDIICYDILSSDLILLKNNGELSFNVERHIPLSSMPLDLKTVDFNNDSFNDVAILLKNKFEMLWGDSVSSFKKNISVTLPFVPKSFENVKINKDRFEDFVIFSPQEKSVFAIFNGKGKTLSEPLKLFDGRRFVDVCRNIFNKNKLCFYDDEGKIFRLIGGKEAPDKFVFLGKGTPEKILQKDKNLVALFQPDSVLEKASYYWGKKVLPLYRTDKYGFERNANVLLLTAKNKSAILQYLSGDNFIFLTVLNFKRGKVFSKTLQFERNVLDVETFTEGGSKNENVLVVFNDPANVVKLKTFKLLKDSMVVTQDSSLFEFLGKKYFPSKSLLSLSWQNKEDSVTLFVEYSGNKKKKVISVKGLKEGRLNFNVSPKVKFSDFKNFGVSIKKGKLRFFRGKTKSKGYSLRVLRGKRKNDFLIKNYLNSSKNEQFSFLYEKAKQRLFEFHYYWKKKRLKINKLIESVKFNDYFVVPFKNNVYLIYIDNDEGLLKFLKANEN